MLNNNNQGGCRASMAVGAAVGAATAVVIIALAPVVAPALLNIGGITASAGEHSHKVDQLVKDHLSP